ncbi:MAG TPA: hypothetical protein VF516_25595, partial [Kofleriaceae bacterium]
MRIGSASETLRDRLTKEKHMRFLEMALGLMVFSACSGELGDADRATGPDVGAADGAAAFDLLRAGHHGDRGV